MCLGGGVAGEAIAAGLQDSGPTLATAPKPHWSGWYAAYIIAREQGRTPEEAANAARSTWKAPVDGA